LRYVVTGAAGFIGSHVCTELLERGHHVLGIDALTDYYDVSIKRRNVEHLRGHRAYHALEADLLSTDLEQLLDGCDAVIHLAGQPGVRLSWAEYFDVYVRRNVTASHRLLEAVRRTRVPRLVMASSSSVYGNAPAYPTDEQSPTTPFSPYGVTKLAMEHLARAYSENWGVPAVMLRYFTVYGPGQRPDMAMHRFIRQADAGQPLTLFGDGEQVRDFTYVSDVVEATIAAATADIEAPVALNVAGGSSGTVNEVLELVAEHVGKDLIIRRLPSQPGDVRITGGSIDRARRGLGWQPAVPLDEGVKRQVAYQLGTDDS
jgi:UDP-glucuronate 4-epimerase